MHHQNFGPYAELLKTPGVIGPQDVRHFRREVFQDGIVSQLEADAIFALNDAITNKCPEWNEFFIEAMTDFTVNQAEPRGYVSHQNAKWLVNRISHDGVVDTSCELELLVRVMARANECPPALAGFALAQVAFAVVQGQGPLARDMHLTKGVIGAAEVELLRTILYAAGGSNGLSISRQEAEILFDLNEYTDQARNDPSWQDLFVRANANYLMAASIGSAPPRSEAIARNEWLEDAEQDVPGFLGDVFTGLGSVFTKEFYEDIFTSSHVQMEKAWNRKNRAFVEAGNAAEAIDPNEADWLIERINRDSKINENERALLDFIRRESHSVDPRLRQMIEKVA